jgi:hypothetical protein
MRQDDVQHTGGHSDRNECAERCEPVFGSHPVEARPFPDCSEGLPGFASQSDEPKRTECGEDRATRDEPRDIGAHSVRSKPGDPRSRGELQEYRTGTEESRRS